MSLENDVTARTIAKILSEGMSLADCDLENRIESETMLMLKNIKEVILSNRQAESKIECVEKILSEGDI